jgi:hypothetical protein
MKCRECGSYISCPGCSDYLCPNCGAELEEGYDISRLEVIENFNREPAKHQ